MTLLDVMEEMRERHGRELSDEEIPLVGRMIEAERTLEEILGVIGDRAYIPTDDELETFRYEAVGTGVIEIPDV